MTREEWLNKALHKHVAPLLAKHGATVPKDALVCVGFPGGGSARKRIGECWSRKMSSKGINELFVSPTISDNPVLMLDILVHEAVHASDDCQSGHKGHFARVARAVGLEGKLTATHAGPELRRWIEATIAKLPKLEHSRLDLSQRKVQKTRMMKHVCPDAECGAIWRAAAKWQMVCCPVCATALEGGE